MTVRILTGDCRTLLASLDAGSVQTCVTSPPYFGLRDYGVAGQIGLEPTPDAFVAELVAVFREVRRALRDDGTLWLNLGDSYAGGGRGGDSGSVTLAGGRANQEQSRGLHAAGRSESATGLAAKQLLGMPWRVAFALQADGWWLRSDIVWSKPNPMPESVTDRPTKSHEYIFLLSKAPRYYYDADAILDPVSPNTHARVSQDVAAQIGSERANGGGKTNGNMKAVVRGAVNPKSLSNVPGSKQNESMSHALSLPVLQRNKRSVWTVTTQGFKGAHFATFPPALIEPCILAGSRRGDTVLDPFGGAGTTGLVADRLQRHAVLVELNPDYAAMARARITADAPLFSDGAA